MIFINLEEKTYRKLEKLAKKKKMTVEELAEWIIREEVKKYEK